MGVYRSISKQPHMLFLASAIRALLSFSSFLPVALAKRAKACWKSGRQRQLSWFQNLRIPHAQTHMNYHEFISSTRIECRMSIYLAKKVPIYRRFAFRKQSHPIRCSETFRDEQWMPKAIIEACCVFSEVSRNTSGPNFRATSIVTPSHMMLAFGPFAKTITTCPGSKTFS